MARYVGKSESPNRERPEPLFSHTTIDRKTGNSRRRVWQSEQAIYVVTVGINEDRA
jgi:hypothetical protein